MKLPYAEANRMINQLRDEYRLILDQESNVVSFIAATTENIEDARPPYDYQETAAKKRDDSSPPDRRGACLLSQKSLFISAGEQR